MKYLSVLLTLLVVFSCSANKKSNQLLAEGDSLAQSEMYNEAIKRYIIAIDLNENNYLAIHNKAYCLFKQNKIVEAKNEYLRC